MQIEGQGPDGKRRPIATDDDGNLLTAPADPTAIVGAVAQGLGSADPTHPWIVQLSNGTTTIATLPVSLTSLPALAAGSSTIGAVTGPAAAPLALDATLTGGTAKAILRGGAKGATVAADITSTANGSDHQAADVALALIPPSWDNAGNYSGSARVVTEERWLPYAITDTATHANMLTGPGTLGKIVINKAVANGVIAVYNALTQTGTPIATITTPATLLQNQVPLEYKVWLSVGLTIVTSVAAQDITVCARPAT